MSVTHDIVKSETCTAPFDVRQQVTIIIKLINNPKNRCKINICKTELLVRLSKLKQHNIFKIADTHDK